MSAVDWALKLARAGFRVFPLYGVIDVDGKWIDERTGSPATHADGSGKRPRLGTDWRQDATTDEQTIEDWWDRFPHSNVGVVMGEGHFVVDCDSDDAVDRFEALFNEFEDRPTTTFWVVTGQGVHHYFRGESRTYKPSDDIDIKGTGGYVVGPGSRSWTGRLYDAPVPLSRVEDAPEWVGQQVRDRDDTAREDWEYLWIAGTGDRNNRLSRVVGRLIRLGLPPDAVRATLAAVNRSCLEYPLDDAELETTLERMATRYPPGSELQDMLEIEDLFHDEESKFFNWSRDRRLRKPPTWTYEGLIPEYGVVQMFGDTYVGKTFVAIDLAMSLCNRKDWMGFPLVREGKEHVLYIMAEGAWGFQQRLNAWMELNPGTSDEKLITVEEQPITLASRDGWAVLWREAQQDEEMLERWDDIGLVVLDTQSLLWAGVEENSNTEMNRALQATKLAARIFNCPVVLVHHATGDAQTGRGAKAIPAGCDTVIKIEPVDQTVRRLRIKKVKAGPLPETNLNFTIRAVGDSAALCLEDGAPSPLRFMLDELYEMLTASDAPEQIAFSAVKRHFGIVGDDAHTRLMQAIDGDERFTVERSPGRSNIIRVA